MTAAENQAYGRLTVVVPTLNEAGTISVLLDRLLSLYPGIKVVVADDVSRDGTQTAVRQAGVRADLPAGSRVDLLERVGAAERGLTASVLDGLRRVATEYCAVMDGDLQHPPEVVGELLSELLAGADLAGAVRLPYRENQGLHRILMTRVSKRLARWRLRWRGIRAADPLSGLFAGRTALVQSVIDRAGARFEPRGYKVLFDLLKAVPLPLDFRQVHYQFGLRPGGHSKLRPAHAFYFLRSLFK